MNEEKQQQQKKSKETYRKKEVKKAVLCDKQAKTQRQQQHREKDMESRKRTWTNPKRVNKRMKQEKETLSETVR